MRPISQGSIVVELMSPLGVTAYFSSLISRVHGALGRGVVTYKRLFFEPANKSHERSIYGSSAPRPEAPSTSPPRGSIPSGIAEVKPSDFDAIVNTSAVTNLILNELRWRAQPLDLTSPPPVDRLAEEDAALTS